MLHIIEFKQLNTEEIPRVHGHRFPNNVDGHFDLSKVFQDIREMLENPVDAPRLEQIVLFIERKKS